jgi:4-amino-4-deoxy-L-arabinose transferase-like glycosyltransferase
MNSVARISRILLIGGVALVLNILFLWYISGDIYHAITQAHGHVGYNVYNHSSFWLSPSLSSYIRDHHTGTTMMSYTQVQTMTFDQPSQAFPVNDTIGYGVLLGLVWKITHSLDVKDVQILQIILYLISLVIIYQIALLFFGSTTTAWWCTGAHLLFFPLIALNVQAVRDVWAYYGIVVLIWAVARWLYTKKSWCTLIGASSWFALCQWIRPTLFLALITVSIVLIVFAVIHKYKWRHLLPCIAVLVGTNVVLFWLPFMAHNLRAYNRLFVGPVGQDLLEGLGEFDNPWGYELNDEFVAHYIGKKYHVRYGTPEFDDMAKKEFMLAYQQYPALYWRNIVKRVPTLLLPGLPWLFPKHSPYGQLPDWREKLLHALSSWAQWWDFILRHVYIRLFLLLGYGGMLLAWYHRRYESVLLAGAVIVASLAKLPSHIEYRYLIPFYWIFSLFVGYLIARISGLKIFE